MAKKKSEIHKITLQDNMANKVYSQRLERDNIIASERGLSRMPQVMPNEEQELLGVAHVLNQIVGDIVIKHPRYGMKFVVNQFVGSRISYLLACGDYVEGCLRLVHRYVEEGDRVLDAGAGIGVTSCIAGSLSKRTVLAIEPNQTLHSIVMKNADLNKVSIQVEQGCFVVGQHEGYTDFHIAEEVWSSSVFATNMDCNKSSDKVAVTDFDETIKSHDINTLIIDIQGSELGFFDDKDMSHIDKAIITINTPLIGEKGTAQIIRTLHQKGLEIQDMSGWSYMFKRG